MKLSIKNLTVKYDKKTVIANLDLQVDKAGFFTILGASGSGKSTILKAIAGLVKTDKGEICMDDRIMDAVCVEERNIAFVFQKPLLFPHLSVAQNISFGPKIAGWKKEAIEERCGALTSLLQIQGLEKRMPTELSGGQQQRVAIGRALALNHKLLLMDEPFSSLDPYLKEEMYDLLRRIRRELELTVIFVTHDVREAIILSDQIGYLEDGKLTQIGEPNELYNYPKTKTIAEFMGQVNWIHGQVNKHVFTSIFGAIDKKGLDSRNASLLLRPQDIEVNKSGVPFQVINCRRQGKETIIQVKKDTCELTIHQLENKNYEPGEWIKVGIRNDYSHIIGF